MVKFIKNFFQKRIKHHDMVLFSSFLYIICAILIKDKSPLITSFLFLVFLTSFFYHSYPYNKYFRIADWLASLSFVYYIISFIFDNRLFTSNNFYLIPILAILSILSWVLSLFTFSRNRYFYNILHTLWHLFGVCIIYLILS